MPGGPASARDEPATTAAENGSATPENGLFGDLRERVRVSTGEQIVLPEQLGAISPELILVAPPELARLARELLPDLPGSYRELAREQVVPLGASRAAPPPAVPRRGIMDASAEPPYSAREILRGTTALAVAAALFAASALAADRSGGHKIASPSPARATVAAASGVAGVSATRNVGIGEGASRRVTPKPPTHAPPAKPAASKAAVGTGSAQVPQHVTYATGSAAGSAPATGAGTPRASAKKPRASKPAAAAPAPRSSVSSSFVPSHVFAWAGVAGARAYDVRFYRNGRLVLELRPARPGLTLPAGFRFQAGVYHWQVTPLLSSGRGATIVDSAFRLTAATAARANSGSG